MIFATQNLSFTLGSMLLEGRLAFAARCVCALLLLAAGEVLRRWLKGWALPRLCRLHWPAQPVNILLDSFAARIYPDEDTRLNTVAAQERVDIRLPVGNDVLRIYRVAVGQSGETVGQWEAEVSMCAYDRIPGGTVSNAIWSHTELANPRGETTFSGGGRGSWWAEYHEEYTVLEPGDTYVTLTYDYLGETHTVKLPLPEGGIPS